MRIAVIAWGSLIWDPGTLEIEGRWRRDGPLLPLEFCRFSGGRRLTLALLEGAASVRAYWAVSARGDLVAAAKNLREREKTFPEHVHYWSRDGEAHNNNWPQVQAEVERWLAEKPDLDAAVWTGLGSNWEARRGQPFDPQDAVEHLRGLERSGMGANAREYLEKAPLQSRTAAWRALMQELDWKAVQGEPPTVAES